MFDREQGTPQADCRKTQSHCFSSWICHATTLLTRRGIGKATLEKLRLAAAREGASLFEAVMEPALHGELAPRARKNLMRAWRLPDYWRKHRFPPQCKPVGSDDFECN